MNCNDSFQRASGLKGCLAGTAVYTDTAGKRPPSMVLFDTRYPDYAPLPSNAVAELQEQGRAIPPLGERAVAKVLIRNGDGNLHFYEANDVFVPLDL